MKVALLPAITQEERDAQTKADELNRLVWITCRVCGLRSKVSLDNPALLCQPCRVDPIQTEAHVLHLRDTLRERFERESEQWDAALASVGPAAYARWGDVVDALARVESGEVSQAAFDATWKRAKAAGGEFAGLLVARERFEQEAASINEGLERCQVSLGEIAAYMSSDPLATRPQAGQATETLYQLTEGRAGREGNHA